MLFRCVVPSPHIAMTTQSILNIRYIFVQIFQFVAEISTKTLNIHQNTHGVVAIDSICNMSTPLWHVFENVCRRDIFVKYMQKYLDIVTMWHFSMVDIFVYSILTTARCTFVANLHLWNINTCRNRNELFYIINTIISTILINRIVFIIGVCIHVSLICTY